MKLTIDNLKAAPYNPRKIDGPSLKALGFSLQEFGDISGITWNKRTGNLVCGHQRLEALKKDFGLLAIESQQIVAQKPNIGGNGAKLIQRFPIRVVDWDLAKEKAANVAANSQFLAGEFTDDLGDILKGIADDLPEAFEKLRLNEFDLLSMGLDEGNTDPDAVPDVPEKPKTKTGDLYLLGDHWLLCGDATKLEDVERLMDGQKADMVFTDPPYGIKRDEGFGGFGGFGVPIARKKYKGGWDDDRPPKECFDLMLSQAETVMIFGGNYFADILPQGKHWIVWDKKNTMPTFGDCELIWTNIKRNSVRLKEFEYNGLIGKEKERYHATQKPVKLTCDLLNDYEKTNGKVLDLFGGSGSTLIACEQTNRKCYMMEIDPHYCDVIVKRWEDFTGKKVRHG